VLLLPLSLLLLFLVVLREGAVLDRGLVLGDGCLSAAEEPCWGWVSEEVSGGWSVFRRETRG
jgi:hypothetical protein